MGMRVQNMIDTSAGIIDTTGSEPCVEAVAAPLRGTTMLQPGSFSGTPGFLVENAGTDWHFYFLVFMLIAYAVARAFLGQLLNRTFTAAVRYNTAVSMYKDNSQLQRQIDTVLYGFYFVSAGFLLMLIAQHFTLFPYGFKGAELFGFFMALILSVFFLRIVVVNIVGHVFFNLKLFREYLFHAFVYNKLFGMLSLPVSIIIVYTDGILNDIAVWSALGMVVVLLIMRIYRGFLFAGKNRVLNFYLFLYLCALELVPMLLLYKWFTIIV
jgi:hypothetical protein